MTAATSRMLDTVLHAVQQYKRQCHLPHQSHNKAGQPGGDNRPRLLVAVSGGADSLALLHVLVQLQDQAGVDLHAATLDHGLRGNAGAADTQFVAQRAAEWNVACTVGHTDVPALAERESLGLEAAARTARYDFLAQTAAAHGAACVVTGHHADDQAETLLLHIIRGASLHGLTGMPQCGPLPGHPAFTLLRPLLMVRRADILAYCEENDLKPREDITNRDEQYARNRLRIRVMPQLHAINPRVVDALARLSAAAEADTDFIDKVFAEQVMSHVDIQPDRWQLSRERFRALHPALQRRYVREAASRLDPLLELSQERLLAAVDAGLTGSVGTQIQLGRGLRLRVDYSDLVVEHEDQQVPVADYLQLIQERDVLVPGLTPIDARIALRTSLNPFDGMRTTLNIPVGARLTVRYRRPGDTFRPSGLGGHHQKLKKWLIDHKVPRNVRDRLPLICVNDTIAVIIHPEGCVVSYDFHPSELRLEADQPTRVVYFGFESADKYH